MTSNYTLSISIDFSPRFILPCDSSGNLGVSKENHAADHGVIMLPCCLSFGLEKVNIWNLVVNHDFSPVSFISNLCRNLQSQVTVKEKDFQMVQGVSLSEVVVTTAPRYVNNSIFLFYMQRFEGHGDSLDLLTTFKLISNDLISIKPTSDDLVCQEHKGRIRDNLHQMDSHTTVQ
jgi:hypothetical protein